MKTYHITVAGVSRDLPICRINDKLDIAGFDMFGDVELTIACARELARIAPPHDVMITAEAKGIPLTYEMARQLGEKRYMVARKAHKLYMSDPVSVSVKSITTERVQSLFLDKVNADYLRGKRVLIVDDVISTGESLNAVEELVHYAGGDIVGRMAVLAEGDAADRKDILFLEKLPLFFK